MLVVDDLTVHYGRTVALRGISLEVAAGELVAAVGPNGAGKSTLLMAIAGARRATAGKITFDGEELIGRRPEDIVTKGVALVPERRRIFTRLTVAENLQLGTTVRKDRAAARAEVRKLCDRFPILGERLHTSASTLSGGEQQQLAIARSLLTRPRLLLIDEPSLGLAPLLVDRIFESLTELRAEEVTILLVEQNAMQAINMADRAYVLRNGKVVMEGVGSAMHKDLDVWRTYFGDTAADPTL